MERSTSSEILHQILNMGEMLLNAGAEIKRVEQTINRLGKAYGAARMDVFAITSSIVVTMSFPDGTEITQTRRIEQPAGTDLSRLERLNALSRRCCENGMSIQELAEEMDRIRKEDTGSWYVYLGSVIGAAAFSVFFGGTVQDGIAAGVFALFICFCQNVLSPFCPNRVIFNLLCSLAAGIGIYGVTAVIPVFHADKIIIGDIMLLMCIRDRCIMSSDVWTAGIQLAMAFVGSLGFCMMFRLRAGLLVPASLGGLFCWAVYLTGAQYVEGIFLPSFIASAFAATYAEVLARKLKAPATLFLIPAVVPLVPGSGLYYTISYAVQGDLEVSAGYGTQTLQFVLGIACGMCIIWALFTTVRPRKN